MGEGKRAQSVNIYDYQWELIAAKAAEIGDPENTSAGLRALLKEYQQLKEMVNLTPVMLGAQEAA